MFQVVLVSEQWKLQQLLSSVQLELLKSLYFLRFLSSQAKCLMIVSLFNDLCRNGFTHIVKIMIISEVIFEFKKE